MLKYLFISHEFTAAERPLVSCYFVVWPLGMCEFLKIAWFSRSFQHNKVHPWTNVSREQWRPKTENDLFTLFCFWFLENRNYNGFSGKMVVGAKVDRTRLCWLILFVGKQVSAISRLCTVPFWLMIRNSHLMRFVLEQAKLISRVKIDLKWYRL